MKHLTLVLVAYLTALPAAAQPYPEACRADRYSIGCVSAEDEAVQEMRDSNLPGGGLPPSMRLCGLILHEDKNDAIRTVACAKRLQGLPEAKIQACIFTMKLFTANESAEAAAKIRACVKAQH